MQLMTEEIRSQVPDLYTQDGKGFEAVVYAKYFSLTNWYWYITEFDGEDTMFGYVTGFENEWGNISLKELESLGIMIERDLHFTPKTLRECLEERGLTAAY